MKYDLMIKNGNIFTAGEEYIADIGIKDGKIVAIGCGLAESVACGCGSQGSTQVVDATGKFVFPGAIDIHTHIDAPLHGSHTLDDWYQGTYAAAFGGVTCVVDYPNQKIGESIRETIERVIRKAEKKAVVDFSCSPVITDRTEEVYQELPQLIEEGFPTYKVFMAYDFKVDDTELTRLLDVIGNHGGLLGVHCENDLAIGYLADKLVAEGKTEPKYHPLSRPPLAEAEATGRVIRTAAMVDAPVLIVHVSAAGALQEIAEARNSGWSVYAETCPHFLLLDEAVYNQPLEEAAKYVVTPPIRSRVHREALWNALSAGTVSLVSSDHCAFPLDEKLRLGAGPFTKIPHGAPGIETRVPLLFSEGVMKGRITAERFVELVSTNPAKLAGLYPQKGTIAVGSDADILIMDASRTYTLSVGSLKGVADFTPFEGYQIQGFPETVISHGNLVVHKGEAKAQPGTGKLTKRNKFKAF